MGANFVVLDLIVGDRTLNAAAIDAILAANPSALTSAALVAVLAAPGTIGGTTPGDGNFADLANSGATTTTPSTVAAAGATQGNATAIGASVTDVIVTVTASTQGLKLPTAALGKRLRVWPDTVKGNKLYPATGGKIGAAATNAALTVVANKPVDLIGVSATAWRVQVGG